MVTTRVSLLLLITALAGGSYGFAAASPSIARVESQFGPVVKTEKQPKKAVLTQVVGGGITRPNGTHRLCVIYERTTDLQPDKGSLAATVKRMTAGGAETIAKIPKTKVAGRRVELCTAEGVALAEGDVLVWSFKLKGMPKLQAGDVANLGAQLLAPGAPLARFRLSADGSDETIDYVDGPNLIFCRTEAGFADLWVRLARDRDGDGGAGPHIDIDLCNYAGGGTFKPLDPDNPSCDGAKTWDVFWHGDDGVFVSAEDLSRCELELFEDGDRLDGSFSCRGMADGEGRTLDLSGGIFRCRID